MYQLVDGDYDLISVEQNTEDYDWWDVRAGMVIGDEVNSHFFDVMHEDDINFVNSDTDIEVIHFNGGAPWND